MRESPSGSRCSAGQVAIALLTICLGACATEKAPIAERPPLQSDVDLCALRAIELGDRSPMGRVRLHLLVRADGSVYAAYVHNAGGIDNRNLQRCLADRATTWILAAAGVEYERAFELSFVPAGSELGSDAEYWNGQGGMGQGHGLVFLPDMSSSSPPLPIEQPVARDTLVVADFATAAENGTALIATGRSAEALPLLRAAVQDQPNDPVALLGLVRALTQDRAAVRASRIAETGSPEHLDTAADLDEARRSALRLLEIAPASEVGHEALLRVCLAARESECAIREWRAAVHAPDAAARSRILYDLQAPTQMMARRLQARMLMPASR